MIERRKTMFKKDSNFALKVFVSYFCGFVALLVIGYWILKIVASLLG